MGVLTCLSVARAGGRSPLARTCPVELPVIIVGSRVQYSRHKPGTETLRAKSTNTKMQTKTTKTYQSQSPNETTSTPRSTYHCCDRTRDTCFPQHLDMLPTQILVTENASLNVLYLVQLHWSVSPPDYAIRAKPPRHVQNIHTSAPK